MQNPPATPVAGPPLKRQRSSAGGNKKRKKKKGAVVPQSTQAGNSSKIPEASTDAPVRIFYLDLPRSFRSC